MTIAAVLARSAALTVALACAGPSDTMEGPVSFSTPGGDAWTFEKVVQASVIDGACDDVVISSPLGAAAVVPDHDRVAAHVDLAPGDNVVEADCRVGGVRRGAAAEQHWLVRLADLPRAAIGMTATDGGVLLTAAESREAPVLRSPLATYQWRARPGNPQPLTGLPAFGREVVLSSPGADQPFAEGDYCVTLRVDDALKRADESTACFRAQGGKLRPIDAANEHPAWADSAVVYGIPLPLLPAGHAFEEVTRRLPELAALGVNTLWLSPITAAPAKDFGYAVSDQFRLRERFGSAAQLRTLVGAAHARGLHVILDLVANHVSDRHPYLVDASAHGRASAYFDFFDRDPAGEPTHYFDWTNLENLNYDNPEVRRLVIEASLYWVREFDIDGFRVDAAWGPRQRAPTFWPQWRQELKRVNPNLLLLAEASARDPYYLRNGFDAAYDWSDKLGDWSWSHVFDDEARVAERLRAAFAGPQPAAAGNLVFRFLNNNDTGARFLTRYGLARTRLAAAMLLTLPGIPDLYMGDETGAELDPYRPGKPIAWDDPQGLRPWYQRLLALRRIYPELRSQDLHVLAARANQQVLAYWRTAPLSDDAILVLLNFAAMPTQFSVGNVTSTSVPARRLTDLLTGETFDPAAAGQAVPLEAHGVRILKTLRPD
jgi:glycosidase